MKGYFLPKPSRIALIVARSKPSNARSEPSFLALAMISSRLAAAENPLPGVQSQRAKVMASAIERRVFIVYLPSVRQQKLENHRRPIFIGMKTRVQRSVEKNSSCKPEFRLQPRSKNSL